MHQNGEVAATPVHAKQPDPELDTLRDECKTICSALKGEQVNRELVDMCVAQGGNVNGRVMAHIYFRAEAKILETMNSFFEARGFVVGVLTFDGLMIERRADGDPATILQECESEVKDRTGFDIRLAEKPLAPTPDDQAKLKGDICVDRLTGMERLIRLLSHHAYQHGDYRKDDRVFQPHPAIHGALVPADLSVDYINDCLRGDREFSKRPYVAQLDQWFQTQDHPRFPMIRKQHISRTAIGFRDGWVDAATGVWHPVAGASDNMDVDGAEPPLTHHYFDVAAADVQEHPTPLWQKLVKTQLYGRAWEAGDDETDQEIAVFDFFQAMIGRLFVPTGTDNWQVWPFLKGEGDTGKGTVIDLVVSMFPGGEVASYDGGCQVDFGREGVVDKRLLVFPDVPKNLERVLAQDNFLSMVSGEALAVARKHKTPLYSRWTVPGIMAGNHVPSYDNIGGRVARRLIKFPFDTPILERDTTLKARISDSELPTIVLNCIAAYKALRGAVGTDELRKHLPELLRDAEDELRADLDPLYNFIQNGDDFYTFVVDTSAETQLEDVKAAFLNHVKFCRRDYSRWTGDVSAFTKAGFEVSKSNICKRCRKKATSITCGTHYDARNRTKRTVLKRMKMIKRTDYQK